MAQVTSLKSVALSFSSNGDNAAIAGVANRVIQVYKIWFSVAGAVNVTFYDGLAGTALSGALNLTGAGSTFFAYYDGVPWWSCSPGNAFNINLSSGVAVVGQAYYELLPH